MTRKIMRNIARINMKKKGYSRLSSKGTAHAHGVKDSWFSHNWKKFVPVRKKA